MTDPHIPDAAVEAAARAMFGFAYPPMLKWELWDEVDRERLRRQARHVLAAGLAAMWRPIEEAPRDGCEVLIATPTEVLFASCSDYGDDDGEWLTPYGEPIDEEPTRWFPLPAPPPASEEG